MQNAYNSARRAFSGDQEDREYQPRDVRRVPSTVVKMITHDSNEDLVPSGMHTHIPDPDFTRVTIGPYGYTGSVEEDLRILATNGFNITPDVVGSGSFSNVMFGYFGVEARGLLDTNGQPLRNVTVGTPFAVKYISFDLNNRSYDAITNREAFAKEKYILSKISHPNIIQIFMTINMGNSKQEQYNRNPGSTYQSFERVYIIMEFADFGSLTKYLHSNRLSEEYCIKFVKEVFCGLRYLYNNQILHRDLHLGNILVCNEGTRQNPVLTVKLADYGLSYVFDGKHHSAVDYPPNFIQIFHKTDTDALKTCIETILYASDCSQRWITIIRALVVTLGKVKNINDSAITKKFDFLLEKV